MDILKDKTYQTYDKLSRYSNFPYYYNTLTKKYVKGTSSHLSKDIDYTYHIVAEGETYDTISLDYYNNPTYFWIICEFNNIQDPFAEPEVGTALRIPQMSAIEFE